MKCPNCGYVPDVNEFDYCEAPGHFFTLGVEMQRPDLGEWYSRGSNQRERREVFGCPSCKVVFIGFATEK